MSTKKNSIAVLSETAEETLRGRCTEANIEFEYQESPISEDSGWFILQMPSGREKREIVIPNDEEVLQEFLSVNFEKYVFLSRYQAICSYRDDIIECLIQSLGPLAPPARYAMERLIRLVSPYSASTSNPTTDPSESYGPLVMAQAPELGKVRVILGPASRECLILTMGRAQVRPTSIFSIRITGAKISRHDQAVSTLERIANASFFEIDTKADISFGLRQYRVVNRPSRSFTQISRRQIELQFPRWEYDPEAVALYWYGCSARGMPLLQFLAFYQSMEFYFPIYSQSEARKRARAILKDPAFNPIHEADINKLFAVIKAGSSRSYGDERAQLRVTMQECVSLEEIRTFLEEDEKRLEFFVKDKSLNVPKIQPANQEVDLRQQIADRIYELRCKIVHTKSSGDDEVQLLLPFSKEADLLQYDIELIKFIAQKALITSSRPIQI